MNCIVYKIGGSLYAIDAGEVVGVENSLNINVIPGQPEGIAGIAEVRGAMTPVVSVNRFFGLPAKREGTTLVVSDGTGNVAYLTDGVEAIREIDFNVSNSAPLIIRSFADCVKNMTLVDGKPVIYMELADIIPEEEKSRIKTFMKQFEETKKSEEDAGAKALEEADAKATETEAPGGEA